MSDIFDREDIVEPDGNKPLYGSDIYNIKNNHEPGNFTQTQDTHPSFVRNADGTISIEGKETLDNDAVQKNLNTPYIPPSQPRYYYEDPEYRPGMTQQEWINTGETPPLNPLDAPNSANSFADMLKSANFEYDGVTIGVVEGEIDIKPYPLNALHPVPQKESGGI